MSSIKIDNPIYKLSHPRVMYNATNGDCTYMDVLKGDRMKMENCVLNKGEFSFVIKEILWLHKGAYFAWDDKGRHLDSIFVDIKENTMTEYTTPSSLDTEKEMIIWITISALGIILVGACLAIIAVRKLGKRRVRKTAMYNLTYRNENQTVASSSRNGCQNFEKAFIPKETRIVSTKNNSEDLPDLKDNKVQSKVRLNGKNIYAQGFYCAKSSSRTTGKLQIDSKLSSSENAQSETSHEYDYVHEYDELRTESTAVPSFEYDYVVQHTFMTLRPPAPDPIVTKKNNQQAKIANCLYSYKKVNKKWSSRFDPSALYAKLKKMRARDIHCTDSSAELRSLDFTNKLSSPCSFELESDFAKKAIDLPKWSKHGQRQRAVMSESSKLQDSKTRSVAQCLSSDYTGNDFDHASAMEWGHRRCRSDAVLYGDLVINTKVPQSRSSSAISYMKEDCYDSL